MNDDQIPNQHERARLAPMTPEEELKHLRERVTELQARGTKQLIDARAAAYEMAAKVCDQVASMCFGPSSYAASKCADEIRKLAKNVP